ncbi:MAG: DUF4062 domain-containing protein [Armatimonadetes bacterium]|nr:DUF4062 domain-containing protein [Armatimonadota bacterium]
MATFGKTFRIFVSSTFSDMKAERNALQERVFPKLRDICTRRGARFQAIDLRWGVSEEAALDQQTMNLCLSEIRRCQQVTPKPNFIVLLGQRYGWRPLPPQIPAGEFEAIRDQVADGVDRALLDRWYRRDDNAVPPEYCLQPRELGTPEDATEEERIAARDAEAREWSETERELRRILLSAINALGWPQDDEWRIKYERSATEQEILEGAFRAEEDHAFAYFRTIEGLPQDDRAAAYVDANADGNLDGDAAKRISDLKRRLRDDLGESSVFECTAIWQDSGITGDHLDALCERVEADLSRVIEAELAAIKETGELDREVQAHRSFGSERARHFIGREKPIAQVLSYLSGETSTPLVVWGPSGSGKSALMARCARLAAERTPAAAVVQRFIGATPGSTDLRSLLESLCSQIADIYGDETPVPQAADELREDLPRRLTLATPEQPLTIFLDALDQLSPNDGAHYLRWLPTDLPEHARIVVSALEREDDAGTCLRVLRGRLPEAQFVEVTPLSAEEGSDLLEQWLNATGRTLQPHQREDVLGKLSKCPYPLFLKVAFEEARHWASYDGLPSGADDVPGIANTTEGVIEDMLSRLEDESNHGQTMLSKALGYLACGRNGLSEDELIDVLSCDGEVMDEFARRSPKSPKVDRLPAVIWSRLRFDLEPYLSEREADGASLMAFYHRQLVETARRRYLSDDRDVRLHRAIGEYFAVRAPWINAEARAADLRRASELAYQQTRGQDWDGVERTLTDLQSLEAKAEGGMTFDLGMDFAGAGETLPADREWSRNTKLLGQALRSDLHFIARHPDTLFQCLWNRVWWYDCPDAASHYDPPKGGWGTGGAPWERPEPKLCTLADGWRQEKKNRTPGFAWVRSLRPPTHPLGGAQLACIRGYGGGVNCVAFDHAGQRVVSGSFDKTVRLWDAHTGQQIACLQGHDDTIWSVAFDRSGKSVVSGSSDNTIRLWDAHTGQQIACLQGHEAAVRCVAFDRPGERVVSGSEDKTVRLWDAHTGQQIACLQGHENDANSVALDDSGERVLSGAYDKTVRLWDAHTGQQTACLQGHEGSVFSVAFDHSGERAASGSGDMTVRLWDARTGQQIACLQGHEEDVNSVAFDHSGERVASGSYDKTVRLWDAHTGQQIACLQGHEDTVRSVAFDHTGNRVVSGSWDNTVRLWDAHTGQQIPCLQGHERTVYSVAFDHSGGRVVSGSYDKTVRLWDAHTGQQTACLQGHEGGVDSVAFDHSGERVASGSDDRTVRLWDAHTGRQIACFKGHEETVITVAIDRSGERVASGSWDNTVRLWSVQSGLQIACLKGHKGRVISVAFDRFGKRVVSGSEDNTVRLWDAHTGQQMACLQGHEDAVRCVAFDRTGNRVVSGSWDGTTRVWDAESGDCLEVIKGHSDVQTLAAGLEQHRLRALERDQETVVGCADPDQVVARHPASLGKIATHPSGRIWAGRVANYVAIIELEGEV